MSIPARIVGTSQSLAVRIYCENDERVYGDLPHLKFERTGTLGKGAERCDFYLKKV